MKSQRCTRSHPLQPKDIRFPIEYRTRKIDFPPSLGTTSYRQHFTKESYQGTRPQSQSNSENLLCHLFRRAYTCCEHARPLLAPPPVQSYSLYRYSSFTLRAYLCWRHNCCQRPIGNNRTCKERSLLRTKWPTYHTAVPRKRSSFATKHLQRKPLKIFDLHPPLRRLISFVARIIT